MRLQTTVNHSVGLQQTHESWIDACPIQVIVPFTGVAALIDGEQVAIFRLAAETEVYAVSNYDPFSKAYVMARGLIGDRNGIVKIASPIYKHNFNLLTGQCLDDECVSLRTWPARVKAGIVQISVIR